MNISKNEFELKGKWILKDGKMIPDGMCVRINKLVSEHLIKLQTDSSGWDCLYRDPFDNRLWELLYLESNQHAGGPPTLRNIDKKDAKKKYGEV